jgi:hypothetical protein
MKWIDMKPPSSNSIRRWVRQWREECSVACKRPPGRPPSVRTPKNIVRVLASVGRSPRRSAAKPAQPWGMSDRSVRFVHPESSTIQTTNCAFFECSGQRGTFRIMSSFFKKYWLKIQTRWPTFWWAMRHVFIRMAQNFRYWSAAIPHELHQPPLYGPKVTAGHAVWSREITGPHFFEDKDGQAITVKSQRYTETINEFLAHKLPPHHNLWFQKMVLRPTRQWLASLLSPSVSAEGDFSCRWRAMTSSFTGPNSTWPFSVGVFAKYTSDALQT